MRGQVGDHGGGALDESLGDGPLPRLVRRSGAVRETVAFCADPQKADPAGTTVISSTVERPGGCARIVRVFDRRRRQEERQPLRQATGVAVLVDGLDVGVWMA